jgi:hypothetical protein
MKGQEQRVQVPGLITGMTPSGLYPWSDPGPYSGPGLCSGPCRSSGPTPDYDLPCQWIDPCYGNGNGLYLHHGAGHEQYPDMAAGTAGV